MSQKRLVLKKVHALQWVFEAFEGRSDFIQKTMFGCQAAYLGHRIVLVVADKQEPWNGILVPTQKEFHSVLMKKFPLLHPHPIIGKWLYLSQKEAGFEELAGFLVSLILKKDSLIGVDPKPKKNRRRSGK